jgi:hypothetical protein
MKRSPEKPVLDAEATPIQESTSQDSAPIPTTQPAKKPVKKPVKKPSAQGDAAKYRRMSMILGVILIIELAIGAVLSLK